MLENFWRFVTISEKTFPFCSLFYCRIKVYNAYNIKICANELDIMDKASGQQYATISS